MDRVELRGWKREDLDQVADLWFGLATLVSPMDGFYRISPDARKKYMTYLRRVFRDPNYAVFVAEGSEGLVGFAMGRINRNPSVVIPESVGYIENVFVKEERRKSGIGKALCSRLLDWFKEKGIGHVELFYQLENRGAEAFWKTMGFKAWLAKAYMIL
ncbi:MAG: GNAT family N-acetyltransferase [Deltaproteobacteria bacterium]|nr:GNAT family N-acetyltransferase [Deltaproteobacteria bacterium]MBW2122242.1 GNAT family N-acetyltransferase [Deltaproteobacteria bacterium]